MIMKFKKKIETVGGYDYVMSSSTKLGKHMGKWIIIYDNEIVASNENLIEIYNKFKKEYPNKIPFIMKLAKKPNILL